MTLSTNKIAMKPYMPQKPNLNYQQKYRPKFEFEYSDYNVNTIAKLAKQHAGIIIDEHKSSIVYLSLVKRIRALKFSSFREYTDYLNSPKGMASELQNFINSITINYTGFFREQEHFDHLAMNLKLLNNQKADGDYLRIWSAGCSSGMEAYSIAITCLETIHNINDLNFRIIATDIDTEILAKAKTGMYASHEVKAINKELLAKYFTKTQCAQGNPTYKINENVRKLVLFEELNLNNYDGYYPYQFNIIFCRNVLMYFSNEDKNKILQKFNRCLKREGMLYVNGSEKLLDVEKHFSQIGQSVYLKEPQNKHIKTTS